MVARQTGKMRIGGVRLLALAVAGCLLGLGSIANAQGSRSAGFAERDRVEEVNVTRSTITLADTTYAVTASSRLYDENGGAIALGSLRAANGSPDRADMVEYTVSPPGPAGGLPEIDSLTVVEGSFE